MGDELGRTFERTPLDEVVPRRERLEAWQSVRGEHARLDESFGREVGGADGAHLARADERVDGAEALFEREVDVVAVEVQQVDAVDAEAIERVVDGCDEVDGPPARWSGWRPTLVVTTMRSRVPREAIHAPMMVSLRPAAKLSAVSMIAPPVPAYRSSTANAASASTVQPKVEPPSASGCPDRPVSPIVARRGTVIGPDSGFEVIASTRCSAVSVAVRSTTSSTGLSVAGGPRCAYVAPATLAACACKLCRRATLLLLPEDWISTNMRECGPLPHRTPELGPNCYRIVSGGPRAPARRDSAVGRAACRGVASVPLGARAPLPGSSTGASTIRRGTRTRRSRWSRPRARRAPTRRRRRPVGRADHLDLRRVDARGRREAAGRGVGRLGGEPVDVADVQVHGVDRGLAVARPQPAARRTARARRRRGSARRRAGSTSRPATRPGPRRPT